MMVDPEEYEPVDDKQDVAIIGPQQLDADEPEPEPLADDCMLIHRTMKGCKA